MEAKKQISRTGVYGIAIHQGNILMVEQQQGLFAGKFDLPGGGIEFGETPEQALKREFHEEVSGTFDSQSLFDNVSATTQMPDYSFHQIGLIYKITGLKLHKRERGEGFNYSWQPIGSLTPGKTSPIAQTILLKLLSSGIS
jgi:8-oxo-dGTP diphosphatase